jgi:hypothetical protein
MTMGTTFTVLDQGTTLAWTQSYGTASTRERARERMRDTAFALALLVFVSGAAGFLTFDKPAPFYAQASTRPAL